MIPRRRAWVVAAALVLTLPGCGGAARREHRHHRTPARPAVLHVYVSLPASGAGRSALNGALLAFEQAGRQAGRYRIVLDVRNPSRNGGRGQAPPPALDAREAATDQQAILFIGGFSDTDAELSVPILNLATIPEISVGSTYVGLTQRLPQLTGALEPGQYYPTGARTLLRLVPDQAVQAAADLEALAQQPCPHLAIANDGSSYGRTMDGLATLARPGSGVTIVGTATLTATPAALRAYTASLHRLGADCLAYFGRDPTAAAAVIRAVHLALPVLPILVPDRLCNGRVTNPAEGGVPAAVAPVLLCTSPWLPLSAYPGARTFTAAYLAAYHSSPAPQAIFGYEAMQLGLDAIAALGPQGDNRGALVRALRDMPLRRSVIGAYRFDPSGDTTLKTVGLFRVSAATHLPVLKKVLVPVRVP